MPQRETPVETQSSLFGAHELGHEGGLNSSYPTLLHVLPVSLVGRKISMKCGGGGGGRGFRGGWRTHAQKPEGSWSNIRVDAAAAVANKKRVCGFRRCWIDDYITVW